MLNVIITIDVENPQTDYRQGRVLENLVDPFINDEFYGVSKIAEILDRYYAKGVFFITTSEKYIFGEKFYHSLCRFLNLNGHEVAIHSHPEWISNDGRIHMWQYTFDEQLLMLREMKQDIINWIGVSPVSHRAGAYGVNHDTFKALDELGILVDSSNFAEHDNCKVQLSYNNLVKVENLLEVPVTGFYKIKRINLWGLKIPVSRVFIKTDIETCSLDELKWFANYSLKNNIQIMNLFMHSYSLLNLSKLPHIALNNNDKKLSEFLGFLKERSDVQFTTLKDYINDMEFDEILEHKTNTEELVPTRYQDFSVKYVFFKLYQRLRSTMFCFI